MSSRTVSFLKIETWNRVNRVESDETASTYENQCLDFLISDSSDSPRPLEVKERKHEGIVMSKFEKLDFVAKPRKCHPTKTGASETEIILISHVQFNDPGE